MEKFNTHKGIVALIEKDNIDTDQIIPKQFLKKIGKTGFGESLFFDWRYLKNGQPNPDFVLNKPEFADASILLTGNNFGCGSSREHAPWALLEYGFKVIIAASFADIFYNNCHKNGILPIVVAPKKIQDLFDAVKTSPGLSFEVDLFKQTLTTSKTEQIKFEIEARQKEFLLNGLDEISWSLQFEDNIKSFEQKQKETMPWLWTEGKKKYIQN